MSSLSYSEIIRLIGAARVSRTFEVLLLTNPKDALDTGYEGSPFSLSLEQQELIFSIQAQSIEEFASQLVQKTKR